MRLLKDYKPLILLCLSASGLSFMIYASQKPSLLFYVGEFLLTFNLVWTGAVASRLFPKLQRKRLLRNREELLQKGYIRFEHQTNEGDNFQRVVDHYNEALDMMISLTNTLKDTREIIKVIEVRLNREGR